MREPIRDGAPARSDSMIGRRGPEARSPRSSRRSRSSTFSRTWSSISVCCALEVADG